MTDETEDGTCASQRGHHAGGGGRGAGARDRRAQLSAPGLDPGPRSSRPASIAERQARPRSSSTPTSAAPPTSIEEDDDHAPPSDPRAPHQPLRTDRVIGVPKVADFRPRGGGGVRQNGAFSGMRADTATAQREQEKLNSDSVAGAVSPSFIRTATALRTIHYGLLPCFGHSTNGGLPAAPLQGILFNSFCLRNHLRDTSYV